MGLPLCSPYGGFTYTEHKAARVWESMVSCWTSSWRLQSRLAACFSLTVWSRSNSQLPPYQQNLWDLFCSGLHWGRGGSHPNVFITGIHLAVSSPEKYSLHPVWLYKNWIPAVFGTMKGRIYLIFNTIIESAPPFGKEERWDLYRGWE